MTTRQASLTVTAFWGCFGLAACAPINTPQTSALASLQTRLNGAWHLRFADADAERLDELEVSGRRQVVVPRVDTAPIVDPGARALDSELAETASAAALEKARNDEQYLNDHHMLLAPANHLSIAVTSFTVTIVHDSESSTYSYSASGESEKQLWAGIAVNVKSAWTDAALAQEIEGDHDLKLSQVFQPSPDGQALTVTLNVISPKLAPPFKPLTRMYVRVPAGAEGTAPASPAESPLSGDGFGEYHFGMTADAVQRVTACSRYYLGNSSSASIGRQPTVSCPVFDFDGLPMKLRLLFGADKTLALIELTWDGSSEQDGVEATDVVLSYLHRAVGDLQTVSGQPTTGKAVFAALAQQLAGDRTSRSSVVTIGPLRVVPNEDVGGHVLATRDRSGRVIGYSVGLAWTRR